MAGPKQRPASTLDVERPSLAVLVLEGEKMVWLG